MPSIRRKQRTRTDWGDSEREQLRRGADAQHERFGEVMKVSCRRRYPQGVDFQHATMHLAKLAWGQLRNELLATVTDPSELWAYRRFDLGQLAPEGASHA